MTTPPGLQGPLSLPGALPGPGLCGACVHRRVVVSGRGSRFFLCRRARVSSLFPKYPPLPVVRCGGFEQGDPEGGETDPGDEGGEG